ncbi:MAG: hypothetical protein HC932_00705 [Thermales bacterium]|nr:hypothetical protein [Thermales bacterium]
MQNEIKSNDNLFGLTIFLNIVDSTDSSEISKITSIISNFLGDYTSKNSIVSTNYSDGVEVNSNTYNTMLVITGNKNFVESQLFNEFHQTLYQNYTKIKV